MKLSKLDDENNSSSVSAKQSSKSSLETDDSYNAESIVSNKELEDTSTSSANDMQIGRCQYFTSLIHTILK